MNEKTKKVVAGIVLGTFTFGCATPVFASDEILETLPAQPMIVEQIEFGNMPADVEPYGLKAQAVKALINLIDSNWSKVLKALDDWGAEQQLLKQIDDAKDLFFWAMNELTGAVDSAEELVAQALVKIGVGETIATILAKVILGAIL